MSHIGQIVLIFTSSLFLLFLLLLLNSIVVPLPPPLPPHTMSKTILFSNSRNFWLSQLFPLYMLGLSDNIKETSLTNQCKRFRLSSDPLCVCVVTVRYRYTQEAKLMVHAYDYCSGLSLRRLFMSSLVLM